MPICLHTTTLMSGTTTVRDVSQGTPAVPAVVFVADNPQPSNYAGCAYVLQSGAEITSNPFLLTRTEATSVGIAIAALWLTVGVIKTISRRT